MIVLWLFFLASFFNSPIRFRSPYSSGTRHFLSGWPARFWQSPVQPMGRLRNRHGRSCPSNGRAPSRPALGPDVPRRQPRPRLCAPAPRASQRRRWSLPQEHNAVAVSYPGSTKTKTVRPRSNMIGSFSGNECRGSPTAPDTPARASGDVRCRAPRTPEPSPPRSAATVSRYARSSSRARSGT